MDFTLLSLKIAATRTVKLGGTVATVGFPDIGLQGFAPKLAKGEIASLAGAADAHLGLGARVARDDIGTANPAVPPAPRDIQASFAWL